MGDQRNKLHDDGGVGEHAGSLPAWETPELVSLKISETSAGIFCFTQENQEFLDFLFGTDPNCIIG